MANPTNPNRVVRVKDLNRFKGKCDQRYAQSATSIITVADITTLTTAQLDGLAIGDMVVKSDSTGKHSYRVTYKSATGCCLTYSDAENIETVAYDKVTPDPDPENPEEEPTPVWTYTDTTITAISGKADKATTLAGYGIGDAYTKSEIDTKQSAKADKVSGSVNNQFPLLNNNGNLKASGLTPDDLPQRIAVTDIEALTPEQCDALRPGDIILLTEETEQPEDGDPLPENTETQTYIVSRKDDEQGLLVLTFATEATMSTVRYEKQVPEGEDEDDPEAEREWTFVSRTSTTVRGHTHDDRYYQKSQVYQKSETYTKKETEGYVQSKFGLKYDAENRAVIVPVASVATYQKSKRMIDFTGIAY